MVLLSDQVGSCLKQQFYVGAFTVFAVNYFITTAINIKLFVLFDCEVVYFLCPVQSLLLKL